MKRLSLLLMLALVFILSGCGSSAPPAISVAVSPNAALTIDQGQQVNFTASVTNDAASKGVTWSVSGGGTLTGSTSTAVTYNAPTPVTANLTVTVTATSVADATKSASVTITVTPPPTVTTTSPLTAGTVGAAYSVTLQASGGSGALAWSLASGTLPNGLSLSSGGVISGTPTAAVTSTFTVQVADSGSPALTATKQLSITVNPAPLTIVTSSLPNGTVQSAYSSTLQASGGTTPYTWSVTVGTLPTGLTLNAATGKISGVPTTSGTSTFTVTATDSATPTAQTKSKQFSILVNPVLSISTASLPNGTVGTPYSQQLQSSGGTAPFTWTVTTGTLPAGLSLNGGTGVISGTPTTPGTFNFTVQAADSSTPQQTATKALSIIVNPAPLTITTTTLPTGTVTVAYNATLQSSGGTAPVTWSITVGTLPGGLSLNANTGAITGTPTTAGTSSFTVKATDSTTPTAQTATQALSITVNSAACGTGSESLLNGQYALALQGFNGTNPVGIGGIFDADGAGHIAKLVGIVDINDGGVAGVQLNQAITSASSSYSIGNDQRGCLTIVTGGGSKTFRFSLGNIASGVAATGHVIQFDNSGENVTGILRKQDPAAFSLAAINGNYAFGATAPKVNSGKFAVVGTFTASGGAISAGQVDVDDNGNVNQLGAAFTYPPTPLAFTGTYTMAANGRGTFTISPGGTPVHANLYAVSASEMLTLSTDLQSTNSLFVGSALQTTQSTFAPNSLNAPSILYTTALGNNGGTTVSRISAGIVSPNGSGTFSFSGYQNQGGTSTAQSASGSYSVASNGRVTFPGGGNNAPIMYLVSPNKGFALFTDNSLINPKVESGFLEPQTGSPFSNTSASGTYSFGVVWPSTAGVADLSGVATFANPNVNGMLDKTAGGSLTPNRSFSSTYSIDSTGLGVFPAGCSITTAGSCGDLFYIISPTRAVLLNLDSANTNPDLQVVDK
jgi:Putative Ig domain